MNETYYAFFMRASEIYNSSDGHNRLLNAISSGELKEGTGAEEYGIFEEVLLGFLAEHNTRGRNRIFGLAGHIDSLVRKCEERH